MTGLSYGTPAAAGFDPERVERIRQRAAEWAAEPHTQGLVLVVARNGVVCVEEAWGDLTDRSDSPPMTADAIFMLASLAKPVTAAAAMVLVEEGLLGLTRPLVHYLPELRGEGSEAVLVQHLLTHTAGYSEDVYFPHWLAFLEARRELPPCPAGVAPVIHEQLQAMYAMPIRTPPGTQMSYGNSHYVLLGEVIRRVSGEPFEDFLRARIFEPLGMEDTRFGYDEAIAPRFAEMDLTTALGVGVDVEMVKTFLFFAPNAGAGLFGTARDYARFAQMLLNGGTLDDRRVLTRASVAQMTRNQISGLPVEFFDKTYRGNWGLGLMVFDEQAWPWCGGGLLPMGCLSHAGRGGPAFWIDPRHGVLGIYFATCPQMDTVDRHWDFDLFQNLVTAAVAE